MAQRLLSEAELLRALNAEAEGASAPQKKTGYYARPEFGKESEGLYQTAKTSEAELSGKKTAFQQAQRKRREAEECLALMTQQAQLLQENYQRSGTEYSKKLMQDARSMLEQQLISFADIQGGYDKAYADYDSAYRNYTQAVSRYNSYLDSQRAQFEAWKGTIRDGGTVQGELDAIDAQISKLKKEDKLSELNAFAGKLANSLANSLITTSSGLAPTTVQYPAAANDAKLRELEAARALLQEEYDWGEYFRKKELPVGAEYLPADYGSDETRSVGQAGWADYQAQQERYKNQLQAQPKEKTFWQTVLEGIAGIGSDTTLPGVGGSQVVAMSKEAQSNDPTMPRDNWTDDERYAFGYLWNTQRQKAYDFARAVNSAYAQQDEAAAAEKVKQNAAKNFGSGVGSTIGAIAAAPFGLADSLQDLIEYGATGHTQTDGSLSPFEWSQAVKGGVSQKLNEKGGTIDERVPVIGGKGWGDVYNLGTSVVNSLVAAYTGGAGQALITNFGPAMAAASDDAKSRGATDGQALGYGFLSGLAEAAAEMVGVDKLLQLGSADSLKAVFKNILKQGTTEALEEGLTSAVDQLADNIVLRDKSVLNQTIASYMKQGMSRSAARKRAWLETVEGVAADMLGGFLSGAASGGVETIVQTVPSELQKNAQYKTVYGTDVGALIDKALELNPDNALAQKLKKAVDSGKPVSGRDISRLVEANEAEIRKQQETATETDTAEEGLQQAGQVDESEAAQFTLQKEIERQWDSRYEQDNPAQSAPEAAQDIRNDQNTGVAESEEPLSVAARLRQQEEGNGGTQYVSENEQAQRVVPSNAGAGTGVSYGGGQRYAGQSAGEQAGILASSTAQRRNAAADRSRAAVARQNLARSLRLEKVSSLDLGVQRGTESRNVQVLPQEHWDSEMAELADRIYEETGKNVDYVVGRIQIRGSSGNVAYARGVITGDRIIIQADHLRLSMEQIADHEAYHAKVNFAAENRLNLNNEIRRHIIRTYSEEQFQKVLEKYIVGLSSVIDVNAAHTGEEYEAALRQIEEEIFADAYAGINAFGANADQFTEAVNEKMEQLDMGKMRKQENGVRETNGPPVTQKENTAESGGERYSSANEQDSAEDYLESANMTMQEYEDGESVAEFILAVSTMIDQSKHSKRKKRIGVVSKKHADLIDGLMQRIKPGFSANGYELWIDGTGASHIEIRHGANGKADHSMATKEAKMLIPWASQNADACEFILTPNGDIKRSYRFKNSDGTSPPEISMEKRLGDDTVYVSECVPDSMNKRIWITSAYIKKGSTGQMLDMEETSPQRTPEAPFDGSATTDIVATPDRTVKERFSVDDSEYQEQQAEHSEKKKPKPVAESRPLIAKKDLRNTMMNLFSVPDGSRAELGTMIDNYADRLIKNGTLTEADRKAFFDRMYESGVMTMPAKDYYAEARSYLKDSRIYVPESVVADFGDDWSDIRRRAFASGIYLTRSRSSDGHSVASIDVWNSDLAGEIPGLFNAEETDQRSILERIVQVAEEGKDENMSLAEYTARLAESEHQSEAEFLDNMERQMDWALRTFAEKARLEVHLRDRTGRKIAQERQKHQESAQLARDRKELRELQEKTLKQLRWLSKNRNRAPEELRATWDEVLGDIDLYAIGAANEMRWSDKYNATWKDLAQMYKDAQENDPNFMPSKELKMIVDRLDGSKIADMDIGALQDLYKAAVGLRTEFYNRNNVVGDEMHRLFAEVYTDAKKEIESAPGENSAKKGKVSGWVDKFLNMDQLTPMNVLQRMAGWDPNSSFFSMVKQLERGERDMRAYHVKAQKILQEFLTEHEDWVKKADGQGKDGLWYKIEIPELVALELGKTPQFGGTIEVWITPMQKIHMYLESKNQDNLRHMTGGRTFADKRLYSEGKRQEAFAQGKTVRMAPETVKAIVKDLTAEEMELAQILDRYYNTFATQEINKVANILYGYDKAMGKNYAPICVDKDLTNGTIGIYDETAEGVGHMKERQHSHTPSYNISALDAFEIHVDQTARFVGMAIPARNWEIFLNWKVLENGNLTGTRKVITKRWGKEGEKYIENLIATLQGGDNAKSESVGSTASKLQSNYISAVFGTNPGIVLKQLGSIPMAGAYLEFRNLPKLDQLRIDRTLISKYTQELEWRTMGYATPEIKQLKNNPSTAMDVLGKVVDKAGGKLPISPRTKRRVDKGIGLVFGGDAITAMDGWAASTLWPWAENKVRREYPELEVGTQAQVDAGESPFYKKVAEEFENALSRSQSVSDEIHQSTLRKSKNLVTKTFTMFRSDSAQTYNALRQKIGEAQFYVRTGAKDKVQAASKKAVGTVVCALLMNAVWSEAVSFLMALWKNKGKYYRDDEDELTVESTIGEMGRNMMESIMGTVTFGDEIAQLIGNAITGDRRYDLEAPGLEQINEIFNLVQGLLQGNFGRISEAADVVKNGGNLGKYLSDNSGEILGEIKDTATKVATYFGLSVNNVEAYLLGALKWVSPELGTAYDDLFRNVSKSDLSGLEGGALEVRISRILSDRRVSESDETTGVLAALYEAGYKTAIPSDTPESVSIDGEKHTLGVYQKQTYDMIWGSIVADALDEIVASDSFAAADQKSQAKMLGDLYTYAAEQAKSELFDGFETGGFTKRVDALKNEGKELADAIVLASKYGDSAVDDYLQMTDAGMDQKTAEGLLDEIEELEPLAGEEKVQDVQRWRTCVDFSGNEAIQLAGLAGQMQASQFAKVQIAHSFGVTPDAYVGYYEIREKFDTDHSGSYSNAEVQAAIDSMISYGLTNSEKAVLWQLATGSKSAKNNPYSVEVGEKVLAAK